MYIYIYIVYIYIYICIYTRSVCICSLYIYSTHAYTFTYAYTYAYTYIYIYIRPEIGWVLPVAQGILMTGSPRYTSSTRVINRTADAAGTPYKQRSILKQIDK